MFVDFGPMGISLQDAAIFAVTLPVAMFLGNQCLKILGEILRFILTGK